jgi:hypothetical protein
MRRHALEQGAIAPGDGTAGDSARPASRLTAGSTAGRRRIASQNTFVVGEAGGPGWVGAAARGAIRARILRLAGPPRQAREIEGAA